ncbi:MAG: hypothetical protein JST62_01145 [Bacteroidetes bacterium]|nr:hypothetical protein [Bacteroidota bacterium]
MFKKITISFLIFFGWYALQAQLTSHVAAFVGYQYQKQSFGELGLRYIFLKNDNFLYRLGGGVQIGEVKDKIAFIPKLQGDFLWNTNDNTAIQHPYYFIVGTEVSTQAISPKVGISLFGILDFTAGYSFAYNDIRGKKLDGVNANITVNIPLVVFAK